jgi:hypothetical protein
MVSRAAVAGGGLRVAIARQIEIGASMASGRVGIARAGVISRSRLWRSGRAHPAAAALLTAARPPSAETSGGPASGTRPSGVEVAVGEIAVDDGTLTLDDAIAVPPARLTFTRLTLSARDVAWPASRPVRIAFRAATPGAGAIEATGTASLNTVSVDLRARLSGAALAPYRATCPRAAALTGARGLAVAGALFPRRRHTRHRRDSDPAWRWRPPSRPGVAHRGTGVEYRWSATLVVDRLHVGKSRVRVVRQADGAFPLRASGPRGGAAESEAPRPPPARAAEGPAPSPARDSGPPALRDRSRGSLEGRAEARRRGGESAGQRRSVRSPSPRAARHLARAGSSPSTSPSAPGGGSASARG